MINIKSEKGSITTIVFVTILFFIVILESVYMSNTTIRKSQLKSQISLKETYEESLSMVNLNYNSADVVKKDGSWNISKGVNSPKIDGTGLIPIYWDENGVEVTLTEESSLEEWNLWYDYSNQKWANAKTADGSYWVWVPRYAYQITSNLGVATTGTIEIKFLQGTTDLDAMGDTISREYPEVVNNAMTNFFVHPAFIDGRINNYANGEWDAEIPGFWIAKYQAGYQNSTKDEEVKNVLYSDLYYTSINTYTSNFLEENLSTNVKLSYPVFKPNTYALNIICAGDAFLLSKEISKANNVYELKNLNSHLEKNSEWGALAYLTHSKYGVDGAEVKMNKKNLRNSIYVNNATSGNKAYVYVVTSYGENNEPYDVSASSTSNVTGVFDISGGVWERVAYFYKGGASSTTDWHSAMATAETTENSKYLTIYDGTAKKGDATSETAGWNTDFCNYMTTKSPVCIRGGRYNSGENAGIFAYSYSDGTPNWFSGFRVCLIPN